MDRPSNSLRKQKKPSFFKILIKDFSARLQIPPAFIKKFDKQMPNKAILEAYHEKSWEVEVEKLGKIFCFSEGWGKFVEENNLEHGDFLVFKYFADSKFKVTIYGRTCCLKQFPVARERNSEPLIGKEGQRHVQDGGKRKWVQVDDDSNKDEELKGARRNKSKFDGAKAYERDVIRIDSDSSDDEEIGVLKQTRCKQITKAPTIQDKQALKKSAKWNTLSSDEQIEFNSQYPFFKVKLKASNINGGYLYIPKSFRKYMTLKEEQEVKFQISNNIWSMGLQIIYNNRRNKATTGEARICQGWRVFVRANELKLGDFCIFEMITSDDFVFSVHVYRWDAEKAEFVQIL